MDKINVRVKKTSQNARIPEYKTIGSAGFDLYAMIEGEHCVSICPNETTLISTGLAMEIPLGYEVQIRPRSGMSINTKLRIANSPGTIDSDFRGEIKIIAENIGDTPITIKHHDRIAQGVLKVVPQANFVLTDSLSDTDRGAGGFGHSGK